MAVNMGFSQFEHTYPYILLHYEINKNDEKVYEPILERRRISLLGEMGNIFKIEVLLVSRPLSFSRFF